MVAAVAHVAALLADLNQAHDVRFDHADLDAVHAGVGDEAFPAGLPFALSQLF